MQRPGRFDRELEIGIPSAADRLEILTALLRNTPHTITTEELTTVADKTHGYVGADLAAVCNEAGLLAVNRSLLLSADRMKGADGGDRSDGGDVDGGSGGGGDHGDGGDVGGGEAGGGGDGGGGGDDSVSAESCTPDEAAAFGFSLTVVDLQGGLREVRPSAMREITLDVPKVLWSDIGGQEETKNRLREAVEWPAILHAGPPLCMRSRILPGCVAPPRSVLLRRHRPHAAILMLTCAHSNLPVFSRV